MELLRRLEAEARERLPEPVYDYFAGGAGDEVSLHENEAAWRRAWLRPRQLTGVHTPDLTTRIGPTTLATPVLCAPAAAQRLLHPDGEVAAARAAGRAGTAYCLSTRATADLAEVAAAATGPLWFQLYFAPDRDVVRRQLERAAAHGYEQVVMTIDLPVSGRREREERHGPVALPPGVHMTTHLGEAAATSAKPMTGGWATLTWDDVDWVREVSGLPVMVKGVLTAEDALLAEERGVSAVVVSNHGARQLDGVIPTAEALPEVADALGGRVPVLVDGGLRNGSDVVRALALGADAVLVGRPFLWGLACGGEDGVLEVLAALTDDVARSLAMVGAASAADVQRWHVRTSR